MGTKNEVFEYLIDQLRQQVDNNPYKQQCEDLVHGVQSLKNQLRDALERETELQKALNLLGRQVSVLANKFPHEPEKFGGPLPKAESYVVGEHGPEQSGCRKEDTQGCKHEWVEFHGLFISEGDPRNEPGYTFCRKCGLKEYSRKCEHEWSMVTGDGQSFYECDVCGARSKDLPYDLRWLAL